MNTESFRSLCAAVLLLGFLMVGAGGWGAYFIGKKDAKEKEQKAALQEQLMIEEISSLERANEELRGHVKPADSPAPTPVAHVASPTPSPSVATQPKNGRALDDKQHREIVENLRKRTGKIAISTVASDAESLAFASTLKRVFEEAGWHVDGIKQVAYEKPPVGLSVAAGSFPSPENMVTTYRSLTAAGLKVSQQLDAKLTGSQVELVVGAMQ